MVKNLEMSKMALMRETPLIQVVDAPYYPLDKVKLGKMKGAVIGGFLFVFLTVIFILLKHSLTLIVDEKN